MMSQSKEQDESIAVVYMVVSVGADLHSHNLCMYIHTLCVSVCLLEIQAQTHCWLNRGTWRRSSLSSLKLLDWAAPNSLRDHSIFALFCEDATDMKAFLGHLWHLSTTILQGLPLLSLRTKAVNQKRSISKEKKFENYILLIAYIFTACQTGLAFLCILLTIHTC